MADAVGVSASTVSREAAEASEAALKRLLERRFDNTDLPREQQAQTASLMRAAWKLNQKDGTPKFRQIASWLKCNSSDLI